MRSTNCSFKTEYFSFKFWLIYIGRLFQELLDNSLTYFSEPELLILVSYSLLSVKYLLFPNGSQQ